MKLKGTAKLTAQNEPQGFQIRLFEIVEDRTWKGRTSSCRPSKPDSVIWLARPAGACTALFMSDFLGFQTKYIWNP